MPIHPYEKYEDIPYEIAEYLKTVGNVERIEDMPLDDINTYLLGLNEFLNLEDTY